MKRDGSHVCRYSSMLLSIRQKTFVYKEGIIRDRHFVFRGEYRPEGEYRAEGGEAASANFGGGGITGSCV